MHLSCSGQRHFEISRGGKYDGALDYVITQIRYQLRIGDVFPYRTRTGYPVP
jgi:hypothetical protein